MLEGVHVLVGASEEKHPDAHVLLQVNLADESSHLLADDDSTTDVNSCSTFRWKRRRMSAMPAPSPRSIRIRSAGVQVPSSTTTTTLRRTFGVCVS